MPVRWENNRLIGDAGCRADRGRCIGGAWFDAKCGIVYVALGDGSIYARSGWDRETFLGTFADNLQPGCYWNGTGGGRQNSGWSRVDAEAFRTAFVDIECLAPLYKPTPVEQDVDETGFEDCPEV
jgi:hypothetical protein